MRGITKKILFLLMLIPVIIINVTAAQVPYNWIVGGENVNTGTPNSSNTATLEKDGKTVTLKLNNYSGGALKLDCYGTGQSDMQFIINLTGKNTITSADIGIDLGNYGKVNFTGEGDLTINAPKPISYESYVDDMYINPSNNDYGNIAKETQSEIKSQDDSKEEKSATTTTKKTTKKEEAKENDLSNINNIILIVFGIYIIISMATIILLILKLSKKKTIS